MMHCWAKRRHPRDWHPLSALGLDPLSSHSPSAPLILSKSHYNPTNPTASHRGCLLSGSPALHIRIWSWAGGSSSSPITIYEKADSLLSLCPFLLIAGKCISGPAAGVEGAGFGEVGGNSVTGRTGRSCFYWPVGASFSFCPHSCALTEEHPKWRKN